MRKEGTTRAVGMVASGPRPATVPGGVDRLEQALARPARAASRENLAAFTLLEVAAGMVFITLALMGLGALFLSSQRAYETAMEEAAVTHSFRLMAERIRGTPFGEINVQHQGRTFQVDEVKGTGTVTVFVDETASSADAAILGLPRDLDGDGAASTTDVSSSYILLPVMLEVRWTNMHGAQSKKLHFLVSQEE